MRRIVFYITSVLALLALGLLSILLAATARGPALAGYETQHVTAVGVLGLALVALVVVWARVVMSFRSSRRGASRRADGASR